MPSNVILIDGQIGDADPLFDVGGVSLRTVRDQLDPTADEIEVHINSMGGDVNEGFAIHDFLVGQGKKVKCVVIGQCYSIATIIFLAGEERLMYPNAELMIHNPWGIAQGDADELEKYADWVRLKEEQIVDFYAKRTGLRKNEIRDMMEKETFLSYNEAKEMGFATGQQKPLKAVALFRPETNKQKSNMEFSEEQKTWMQKAFDNLEKRFKRIFNAPLNMTTLSSGEEIYIEGDMQDLVEKQVFQADQETPLDDGQYTIQDERTITVANGMISEVSDAPMEEPEGEETVEDLKAEIERLKAENDGLRNPKKNEEPEDSAEAEELKAQLEEVQTAMAEMKKKIFGTPPPKPKKAVNYQDEEDAFAGLAAWAKKVKNNN